MKNLHFSIVQFSYLLVLVFAAVVMTSCRGDDSGDQCFDNKTKEPIDIYIDGFFEITIDEGNEDCLYLGNGCFDWYAEGVLSGDFLEGTICLNENGFSSTIVLDD